MSAMTAIILMTTVFPPALGPDITRPLFSPQPSDTSLGAQPGTVGCLPATTLRTPPDST
eukprot:CAMPEP_0182483314 /NCGR_PEP_ID=MMETSP1319-20130603/41070_1 /TAXON_ID=172717 /ORGANISM="Bolidomonas pacifica, Strain RCC208" /LENGTH=58 /DNA_ID=CAMNT_0024685109 /DNA_START=16 /DNA_END=189 /DNA_ORIENTATION=+